MLLLTIAKETFIEPLSDHFALLAAPDTIDFPMLVVLLLLACLAVWRSGAASPCAASCGMRARAERGNGATCIRALDRPLGPSQILSTLALTLPVRARRARWTPERPGYPSVRRRSGAPVILSPPIRSSASSPSRPCSCS